MGCKPSSIGTVRVAPVSLDADFMSPDAPSSSPSQSLKQGSRQSSSSNLPGTGQLSRPGSKSSGPGAHGRGQTTGKRTATPLRGTRAPSGKLRSAEVVIPTGLPLRPPSSRPATVKQQNMTVLSPEGEFFDPLRFASPGDNGHTPTSPALSGASPSHPAGGGSAPRRQSSLSRRRFSLPTRHKGSTSSRGRDSPVSQSSGGAGGGEREVYQLRHLEREPGREGSFLHCPSCGQRYTSAGFAVPHVLHCGHTYCSSCLEGAGQGLPPHLQCGQCAALTTLDTQGSLALPRNSTLLEVLDSKRLSSLMLSTRKEKCAECEVRQASLYCSLCSAAFCSPCSEQTHSYSKVRAKHHPLPIKLRPSTQPVCSRHPGQSCMLYCETEGMPMCVLCKFYGQHRFHSYELLNQAAGRYSMHLSEELVRLGELDRHSQAAVEELGEAGRVLVESAHCCEERLERHFAEVRESVLSCLQRRETVLLTCMDQQVERHQEVLAQQREQLALTRAKIMATAEEAKQLLELDPVSALLERHHVDRSLQQLQEVPTNPLEDFVYSEISLALPHDISSSLATRINQHGTVSRLPPKISFVTVNVSKTTINLVWSSVPTTSPTPSSADSHVYDLHCYMELPRGFPQKAGAKVVNPLQAPSRESGYEDGSVGPSGSVSMVTVGSGGPVVSPASAQPVLGVAAPPLSGTVPTLFSLPSIAQTTSHPGKDSTSLCQQEGVVSPVVSQGTAPFGMESKTIRLPQPTAVQKTTPAHEFPLALNLPPLIHHEREEELSSPTPMRDGNDSDSSGVLGDVEELVHPTVGRQGVGSVRHQGEGSGQNITSSLSNSRAGTSLGLPPLRKSPSNPGMVTECDPMEGMSVGFQFEPVYTGSKTQYLYKGVISMATYYFKVRCRSDAGWSPWSVIIKCSSNKKT